MYTAMLTSSSDLSQAAAFAAVQSSEDHEEEAPQPLYWLEDHQCTTLPPLTFSGIDPAQLERWEADERELRRYTLGADAPEVHPASCCPCCCCLSWSLSDRAVLNLSDAYAGPFMRILQSLACVFTRFSMKMRHTVMHTKLLATAGIYNQSL